MFPERERVRALVFSGGTGAVCHCARAICTVTDPWTRSLQVSWDSLLGLWVRPCICILSPTIPPAVSLRTVLQNADTHMRPSAANEMGLGIGKGRHGVRDTRAICCRGNSRRNFGFMWGERKAKAVTSGGSYHSYSIAAACKFVSPHCDCVCLTDTSISLVA